MTYTKDRFDLPSVEELWRHSVNESPPNPQGAVGKLVNFWAKTLNSEVVSFEEKGNAALFLVDLSQLMLKGLELNLLMVVHPANNREEEREIYDMLEFYAEKAAAAHCLCFVLFLQDEAPKSKELHPEFLDVVVIDGNDIKKQFLSSKPYSVLFKLIVNQIRISRLCPFDTTRPARGEMFRGRKEELRPLIQDLDTSIIVTGSRRVGKSSLIRRAVDILEKRTEYKNRVFFMNCETWGRYESCARQIANRIYLKKQFRIDKSTQNLLNFFKLQSGYGRRPLFLFLDDFDRVTEIDKFSGWRLLKVLHASVTNGWIRVVFVGYRSVPLIRDLNESPFFERIKQLRLPPLENKDAVDLFITPFQHVGIEVNEPEKVAQKIIATSAGYPFVIQFYGENLFHNVAEREEKVLKLEDIDKFEKSFEFGNFIAGFFSENTHRDERLLSLLYAYAEENENWNEGDFLKEVHDIGIKLTINEVHTACRNLVLANIFKYFDGKYDFVFPILKNQLISHWPNLDLKGLYETGGL
ncbi:MAG: ATP-binding protein [Candidatus Aminicenantes bacterium]|jgi:hypothetical protein